jgi:putative endonuclease
MPYAVYILSNKTGSVLYTGFTSDLAYRMESHKSETVPGFASRYRANRLVYFETTDERGAALERERQIKAGSRETKIALINAVNPTWRDLSDDL